MATGDQSDVLARLKALLPGAGSARPWFPEDAPVLTALLQGSAVALAFMWSLSQYAKLQTRIKTATDGWLDLIAFDFFGARIQRRKNETDTRFRNRIIIEILRERGTRRAIKSVLEDLTGQSPIIFEPARPGDTGAWCPGPAGDGVQRGLGYGVAGGYGSLLLRGQVFVVAYRPTGSGIPSVAGWTVPVGAYGAGPGPSPTTYGVIEWGSLDFIVGEITDADIYAAVDSVMPAGTIAWVQITNRNLDNQTQRLDYADPANSEYLPGLNV